MDNKRPDLIKPYSLIQSFRCALAGLLHALPRERNLRIDLAAAGLVFYFSRYYHFTATESVLLILLVGFVIVCELINTAIERTVDLVTGAYHPMARIAKDVAAGAVLVSAVVSVFAGWVLFWDVAVLSQIRADILGHLIVWIPVLIALLLWIFLPGRKTERKN